MVYVLPQLRKPTASWTVEDMMEIERDDAKNGDAAEEVDRNGEEFRSGEETRAKPSAAPQSPSKMEWEKGKTSQIGPAPAEDNRGDGAQHQAMEFVDWDGSST